MPPIYLDHHATTPVAPRVFEAMRPYFTEVFGNPASLGHSFGWAAQEAVQKAREQVAGLLGASPAEIIFTSGATESNNLALKGIVGSSATRQPQLITVATEHRSLLDPLATLQRWGAGVTVLPVESDGRVHPDSVDAAITPSTVLLSVMAANNEIGVLQPIEALSRLARARGILFHTDFAQAAALIPLDLTRTPIDLLTLSGHKIYGPKGVGALYVRHERLRAGLMAQLEGGGQERGLRAGTLNVPGIVGLGEACALAREVMDADRQQLRHLRDHLQSALQQAFPDLRLNGSHEHRLPNNLNVSFPGVDGELLLAGMKDIAVSGGSACNSATGHPSHVLTALQVEPTLARATIRFGLGRSNTAAEIDRAIQVVTRTVTRLRGSTTPAITG